MLRTVLHYEGRPDPSSGVPRPADLRAAALPGLAAALFQQAAGGDRSAPVAAPFAA